MLATLGDLVEDVVVRLDGPVRIATDTSARIARRRGGSAANVAAAAARLGRPVRFLGQVGDDATGRGLVAELAASGVDTTFVRSHGATCATGAIVVLVDESGERSMLTDRGAAVELAASDGAWLRDVSVLHVPLYSFAAPPLAHTAATLVREAHERSVAVSVDVSSVALIDQMGRDAMLALLHTIAPSVVLANADEARSLGVDAALGSAVTVVKRGADPALVHRPGHPTESVPACRVDAVGDTTGAGDAVRGRIPDPYRCGDGRPCVAARSDRRVQRRASGCSRPDRLPRAGVIVHGHGQSSDDAPRGRPGLSCRPAR